MADGLGAFRQGIEEALRQAGYPVTEANVQKAVQVWNAVNASGNMSRADFVAALRYSFTAGGQPPVAAPRAAPVAPTTAPVYVQPGLGATQWAEEQAQSYKVSQLQYQTALDIANINASADRYVAEMRAAVDRELAAGNIDSARAVAQMQIASAEAMQAKQLALDRLMSDRNYEIAQAQVELQQQQLQQQVNEYKAELAANPADWLTYQAFLGGGELPRGASATATQQAPAGDIASAAEALTAGGAQPLYNPALGGVGVGGAQVPGPQEVPHQVLASMTPTEQEMFIGFLKSGIEVAPGQYVAINPEDWLQQASQGFVPGLAETSFAPTYSF